VEEALHSVELGGLVECVRDERQCGGDWGGAHRDVQLDGGASRVRAEPGGGGGRRARQLCGVQVRGRCGGGGVRAVEGRARRASR